MAGSGRGDRDREFGAYYASRGARMRSVAYLMCGDWHLAEDLVQTAFTKLYLAWHRVDEHGQLDRYVRQIIMRTLLDERRRPWRRERATESPPELETGRFDPRVEERMVMRQALAKVPARQRVTLVLRFWEDLSVEETAAVLGVSGGTVKSQTARGLRTLRELLGGQGERYGVVIPTSATGRDVR